MTKRADLEIELPCATLTLSDAERIHTGPCFTVYRAFLENDAVCVKTPSLKMNPRANRAENLLYREVVKDTKGSEYFVEGATTAQSVPRPDDLGRLLIAEARTIEDTAGAWRHGVIGCGVWRSVDERAKVSNPLPALVMPYHEARPMAAVPREELRGMFPRLLLTLWDALCVARHGDVSDDNLLLGDGGSALHVIDPGATLTDVFDQSLPRRGEVERLTVRQFITTAENYPLLSPVVPDGLDEQGRPCSLQSLVAAEIARWMEPFKDVNRHASGAGAAGELTSDKYSQSTGRPAPADLLAIGIIYYRILTGEDPFLGPSALLTEPAWVGEHPGWGYFPHLRRGEVLDTYERVNAVLSQGYVERLVDRVSADAQERALLRALLLLDLADRTSLQERLTR